jgi:hypothetical protein
MRPQGRGKQISKSKHGGAFWFMPMLCKACTFLYLKFVDLSQRVFIKLFETYIFAKFLEFYYHRNCYVLLQRK